MVGRGDDKAHMVFFLQPPDHLWCIIRAGVWVRLAGQQGVVREVLVSMPDGDRSVMSIDPMVVTAAAATPAAKPAARPASGSP